jgi:hypothetical protein
VVVVLAARAETPSEFGHFSLMLALAITAVGVGEAVLNEPLLIHSAKIEGSNWTGSSRTLVLAVGLTFALPVAGVGLFVTGGEFRTQLLAVALGIPFLLQVDHSRYICFARERAGGALAVDTVWVASWITGLVLLRPRGAADSFLVWALSAGVAVMYSFLRTPRVGAPIPAGKLFSELRRTSLVILGEFGVLGLSTQLYTVSVSGLAGFRKTAGLRVVSTIYGPTNVLTNAVRAVFLPSMVREKDMRQLNRRAVQMSITLGACTTLLGILLISVPAGLGAQVFGASWHQGTPLILPVSATRIMSSVATGPLTSLRSQGRTRDTALLRGGLTVLSLGSALVALILSNLVVSQWVLAVGTGFLSVALWIRWLQIKRSAT